MKRALRPVPRLFDSRSQSRTTEICQECQHARPLSFSNFQQNSAPFNNNGLQATRIGRLIHWLMNLLHNAKDRSIKFQRWRIKCLVIDVSAVTMLLNPALKAAAVLSRWFPTSSILIFKDSK